MGLFDRFKKQPKASATEPAGTVLAPVDGRVVELDQVSDKVFSSGALGKGCGFDPAGDTLYAPVSGEVTAIGGPNYHVVGISGDNGAEVLVHVGVDTFDLKGDGFDAKVAQGAHVSAGDPLLGFSREKIVAAGLDPVVLMVLTNSDDLVSVGLAATGEVAHGDRALIYEK